MLASVVFRSLVVLTATTIAAACAFGTDTTDVDQSAAAYFRASDAFIEINPDAQTSQSAVAAIKAFGEATANFFEIVNDCSKQYVEVLRMSAGGQPRSELAALELPMKESGPIGTVLQRLRQRFSSDPEVNSAATALKGWLEQLRNCDTCRNLVLAGAVLRELGLIDSAKQNWEIEQSKRRGDVPTPSDLVRYLPPGRLRDNAELASFSIRLVIRLP